MPNRIIKESIHTSEKISDLTDFQFRLWVSLIVYVDDYGRGDGRPKIIKGQCFPLRDRVTVKDIDDGVHALADAGCVALYTVGGRPYLYLPGWENHQRVQTRVSKFPGPDEADLIDVLGQPASGLKSSPDHGNPTDSTESHGDISNFTVSHGDSPWPTVTHGDPPLESKSESESESEKEHTLADREGGDGGGSVSRATKSSRAEERFDMFWHAYPRKENKGGARKVFMRLKVSDELLSQMLDSVERAKQTDQWLKEGGRFIPYASTWLNGSRWLDEVTPASHSAGVDTPVYNPFLDMIQKGETQ